jgi:Leucine Rich repeat
LEQDSGLTEFHLTENRIGDDGAVLLAKALERNSTLTVLYLGENRIRDIGAAALAEALHEMQPCLVFRLSLDGNRNRDNGAAALAEALKLNSCCMSWICATTVSQIAEKMHLNFMIVSGWICRANACARMTTTAVMNEAILTATIVLMTAITGRCHRFHNGLDNR